MPGRDKLLDRSRYVRAWQHSISLFDASKNGSVIEDKLLRVQQRPENIRQHLLVRFAVAEVRLEFRDFSLSRRPREAAHVEVFDNLCRVLAVFRKELLHDTTV